MDGRITAAGNDPYYVGCSLNSSAPEVRFVVTDLSTNEDVLNVVDYNIQYPAHYFNTNIYHDYAVIVSSGSTTGYVLCEPAN